jgi:hypothetical protein
MRLLRSFFAFVLMAASFTASAASSSADFDQLERQLRLKPHQKEQFAMASSATQTALVATAMSLALLKNDLADELQKPRPDLAGILRSQQAAFALNEPLYREATDEWNKLYVLLEPDQVALAKRYVEEKLRSLPGFLP